jgi:hypothetical protein
MDSQLQGQLNDLRRRLISLNSQLEKADNLASPAIEMKVKNVLIAIAHLEAELKTAKQNDLPES